jgi:hypothetical protein
LMRYDTGNGCVSDSDVVVQYLCEIRNEKCWERGSNLGIVDFLVINPRKHFDIVWNLEEWDFHSVVGRKFEIHNFAPFIAYRKFEIHNYQLTLTFFSKNFYFYF